MLHVHKAKQVFVAELVWNFFVHFPPEVNVVLLMCWGSL